MFTLNDGVERDDAPLILVIDDQEDTMRLIAKMLQASGYRTLSAEDGVAGIAMAEKFVPNAILLDVMMPGMDGYEVCRELRSRLVTADIPVLFVTGMEPSDELISHCYAAGGHDLLTKPVSRVNLLFRIQVALREQALRESYRRIATLDPQTGVNNRRQFFLYVADAIRAARRDGTESILVLGDIDNLSAVNDRFGYDFGDEVMLTFARLLKRFISPDCKVGRIAGDTLGVILKNSSQRRAVSFCQRVSQTFSAIAFDAEVAPKHFSATFGLAGYVGEPERFDADRFMRQADTALFAASEAGHSRIRCYWDLDPSTLPAVEAAQRHARYTSRKKTNHAYVGAAEPERDPLPQSGPQTGDEPSPQSAS